MLKQSVTDIAAANKAGGGHFFDRATLRFFKDTPGNWNAYLIGDRLFINNERHRNGPGMFAGCTLRGQWREVFDGGASIGMPIDAARGLKPKRFAAWLSACGVDRFP